MLTFLILLESSVVLHQAMHWLPSLLEMQNFTLASSSQGASLQRSCF